MATFYKDDEAYDRAVRRFRRVMDDPTGTPIIGADDAIERIDLSPADLELLAARKMDREMIAALYRGPPAKLQMLEFGVRANGEQQAID